MTVILVRAAAGGKGHRFSSTVTPGVQFANALPDGRRVRSSSLPLRVVIDARTLDCGVEDYPMLPVRLLLVLDRSSVRGEDRKGAALQRLHGTEVSFVEAHDAGGAIAAGEHHERAIGEAEF